ncbi:thioesterase II family protein [Streptomyces celluloflavus]|uniref:thioesterase II family protein n=1 Tax=Streptomyces celluloflavus TaxID=58344 RepID=UPI0036D7846D
MPPTPSPPVRLYCFPHAGATSSVYRPWKTLAPPHLQIKGIDPPGRGTRTREPHIADYRTLVDSLADHLAADLRQARKNTPHLRYATFGHSFGATLSLAVGATLARTARQAPERAILSAALPPPLQPPDTTASLTDEELLAKIAADGGTPRELLTDGAMSRYLVRLMREDYAVRRQFPQDTALHTDFPLTLIAARQDAYVTPDQMWQWSHHSSAPSRHAEIPGGHFAALQQPKEILTIVGEDLSR